MRAHFKGFVDDNFIVKCIHLFRSNRGAAAKNATIEYRPSGTGIGPAVQHSNQHSCRALTDC
jgi:hypothetical protein